MSRLKINPDLFIGVPELLRFTQFLDDNGFRKNIIDNTVSYGLIKNSRDAAFANSRVERDLDTSIGQRTIKVRAVSGIDSDGNFISSPEINGIPVPADNNWYWVKLAYAVSNVEIGNFTISQNGDLIDISGTSILTQLLRGGVNVPTRVKFKNSQFNTLEYDVLDVTDDTHATLQHPAVDLSASNSSQFVAEENLQLQIVGTFTAGIAVPLASKLIFNYDSCTIELIQEQFSNTRPTFIKDKEFFLARLRADQGTVIIQDKRIEYWETKGSSINLNIDRKSNPCIGIESTQYNNFFTANDRNIVMVSWGMRSDNWSVDSSQNIVTFSSGLGGKFKSVADFTDGDFNGFRLYSVTGKYHNIINSVKQGGAINFYLDNLDVDNFSTDGGTTFIPGFCFVAPDCDEVEIAFIPNPADNETALNETFKFPVNSIIGRCDVLVHRDPIALFIVQYRYKTIKEFTNWQLIPSDTVKGYLTEDSFSTDDNLKPVLDRVYFPYTQSATTGFIQLQNSPSSLRKFKNKVDKGDIIGVSVIKDSLSTTTYSYVVGVAKNYTYITGDIVVGADTYFSLSTAGAVEGNEFRFHFDCNSLNLNGKFIYFTQNAGTGTILKKMLPGDFFEMLNHEGGIVLDFVYDGTEWVMYQNYDLGIPGEISLVDGPIDTNFDADGKGKVIGLFGFVLMDGRNGQPNLQKQFLVNASVVDAEYQQGETGGEESHVITDKEMTHRHDIPGSTGNDDGSGSVVARDPNTPESAGKTAYIGNSDGTRDAMPIRPLSYAIVYAKKTY